MDVASLAGLLHETAEHHDPYEKSHAPHNWWDWYAAYMTRASTAALKTRHRRPPVVTWRRSCTSRRYKPLGGSSQVLNQEGG